MRTSADNGSTWSGALKIVGENGADAMTFSLRASSLTYNYDRRSSGSSYNPDITIVADVSGYEGTPTVVCETDASYLNEGILTIPTNTPYTTIKITATLEGLDPIETVLTGVDVTKGPMYAGTLPPTGTSNYVRKPYNQSTTYTRSTIQGWIGTEGDIWPKAQFDVDVSDVKVGDNIYAELNMGSNKVALVHLHVQTVAPDALVVDDVAAVYETDYDIPTSVNGLPLLYGDTYYNCFKNKLMYWNGTAWAGVDSLSNDERANAYAKAQKDIISSIPKNTLTTSYYGYLHDVVAETVTADYIDSMVLSNNYTEGSDGYPTSGYKIDGPNGIIKSQSSMFADAQLKNATIDGSSTFYGTLRIGEAGDDSKTVLETIKTTGDSGVTIATSLTSTKYYQGADLTRLASSGDYLAGNRTITSHLGTSYYGACLLYEGSTPKQRASGNLTFGNSITNTYPFKTTLAVGGSSQTLAPSGSYTLPARYWNPQYEFFGVGERLDGVDRNDATAYGSASLYMNFASNTHGSNTGSWANYFPYVIGQIGGSDVVAIARGYNSIPWMMNFDIQDDAEHVFDMPFTGVLQILCNGGVVGSLQIDSGSVRTISKSTPQADRNITLNRGQEVHIRRTSGVGVFSLNMRFYLSNVNIPTDGGCYYVKKGATSWTALPSSLSRTTAVNLSFNASSDDSGSILSLTAGASLAYTLTDAYSAGYHLLNASGDVVKTIASNEYFSGIVRPDGTTPVTTWYKRGAVTKAGTALTSDYVVNYASASGFTGVTSTYQSIPMLRDKITYLKYTASTDTLVIRTQDTTYTFPPTELFQSILLNVTPVSGLVGIKTANIEPVGSNNTIGAVQPFGAIYANNFHGNLNGTASGNVTSSGLADALQKKPNSNLLDNPWFTINQRGSTSYSGSNSAPVYTVDRWFMAQYSSGDSVSVTSNGITWTASTSGRYLRQVFEDYTLIGCGGKSMTISILFSDGTVKSATLTCPTSGNRVNDDYAFGNIGYYLANNYSGSSYLFLRSTSALSVSIRAIKLELGDRPTIQYDTAPNYTTELLKCQRYYVVYNDVFGGINGYGTYEYGITLPVEMRIPPSVSVVAAQYYDNGWRNMSTESIYSTKNSIRLRYSSIPLYATTAVTFNASADF